MSVFGVGAHACVRACLFVLPPTRYSYSRLALADAIARHPHYLRVGRIDELVVFKRTITASEAYSLYKMGSAGIPYSTEY